MRFRPPCGDDVSLVIFAVGVDDRDLDAVHQPNRVDANLAVVEVIVDPLDYGAFEYSGSIGEGDPVPAYIGDSCPGPR